MGSGARHGRAGARHHRRAHRPHHHHTTNHRNRHRARGHHHHARQIHTRGLFFVTAQRSATAMNRGTSAPCGGTSQRTSPDTIIRFHARTVETRSARSPKMQLLASCRVLCILLWFAGIMMMSLGGFRTPVGYVGVACLACGITFLVVTSMIASGSCSCIEPGRRNFVVGQDRPSSSPSGHGPNREYIPREPAGNLPPSTADPAPTYASTDPHAGDKPPSYEEVTGGSYPSTISATIPTTIPEGYGHQAPYDGIHGASELPYPTQLAVGHVMSPTPPSHQMGHSYPPQSPEGNTMPPPYTTSETEHTQRMSSLPYTVSMVSTHFQAPSSYTMPTSPALPETSSVIGPPLLYPPPQSITNGGADGGVSAPRNDNFVDSVQPFHRSSDQSRGVIPTAPSVPEMGQSSPIPQTEPCGVSLGSKMSNEPLPSSTFHRDPVSDNTSMDNANGHTDTFGFGETNEGEGEHVDISMVAVDTSTRITNLDGRSPIGGRTGVTIATEHTGDGDNTPFNLPPSSTRTGSLKDISEC